MKGLSWVNKFAFVFNVIFVLLLLVACATPYISVEHFPFLPFFSLAVPLLVAFNVFFFVYWLIQRKRQMLPSLFLLVFGYFALGTFVKFKFGGDKFLKEDLKIMSYNVRGFDKWGLAGMPDAFKKVVTLVATEKPDIICFQEVGNDMKGEFLDYPYHYLKKIRTGNKVHLGIFSKYPIVNAETINFPNSINNGSYVDIAFKEDTIRVYNVHMQSLGVTPGTGVLRSQSSDRLYRRLTKRFKQQQKQADMIAEHMAKSPYKTILCGDFNNTQFSKVYHTIKGDKQDSFIAEGSGYGRTFYFLGIPFRIDFILADENFEVKGHKNYDEEYSDHFPVMASFRLK